MMSLNSRLICLCLSATALLAVSSCRQGRGHDGTHGNELQHLGRWGQREEAGGRDGGGDQGGQSGYHRHAGNQAGARSLHGRKLRPVGESRAREIAAKLGYHYYDQAQQNPGIWANAILSRYPIGKATPHDLGVSIDVKGRTGLMPSTSTRPTSPTSPTRCSASPTAPSRT